MKERCGCSPGFPRTDLLLRAAWPTESVPAAIATNCGRARRHSRHSCKRAGSSISWLRTCKAQSWPGDRTAMRRRKSARSRRSYAAAPHSYLPIFGYSGPTLGLHTEGWSQRALQSCAFSKNDLRAIDWNIPLRSGRVVYPRSFVFPFNRRGQAPLPNLKGDLIQNSSWRTITACWLRNENRHETLKSLEGKTINATVEVGGIDPACSNTASVSTRVIKRRTDRR